MQAGLRWHAGGACKTDAAMVALEAVQLAQAIDQRFDLRLKEAPVPKRIRRCGKAPQGMQDRPHTSSERLGVIPALEDGDDPPSAGLGRQP
jgi:hypothetical protein